MAKQKSITTLSGTIDGINFYRRNGKYLARKAGGGFSTESFRNNPNMEGVRKRSTDFGHCSKVKKAFKEALRPALEFVNDGTLHTRMMRLFLGILKLDTVHERGAKQMHTALLHPGAMGRLRDFRYTPSCDPISMLGSHTIVLDRDRSCVTVGDWYLSTKDFPNGAEILAFQLGRLHFDFKTMAYEFIQGEHILFRIDDNAQPFTLSVEKPKQVGTDFFVFGMQFFTAPHNGELYESSGIKGAGFCVL